MFRRMYHKFICVRRGVFSATLKGTHHVRQNGFWKPFARDWQCDECGYEATEYFDTGECDLFG